MHYMLKEYGSRGGKRPLGTTGDGGFPARKLAESIILQSIEDLWDRASRKQSLSFFKEKGFSICAGIADLGIYDQMLLLDMINRSMKKACGLQSGLGTGHEEGGLPGER
jgi:hypothetical protein